VNWQREEATDATVLQELPWAPDPTFKSLSCVVACKCSDEEPVCVDVVRTYLNCHSDTPSDPNFTMGKGVSEVDLGTLG
jgi:hypothetical protein